ncbi:MAG: pentapeptide repeat-containing protein [Saprospiraceae bacterium]|nr:pentapeptide repeat-containing protein [Saprospiraceae bacterium]
MSKKLILFLIITISVLTGWFLGFIKIPYFDSKYSFWIGVLAGISFLLFLLIIYWLLFKFTFEIIPKQILPSLFEGSGESKILRFFLLPTIVLLLSISYYYYSGNKSKNHQLNYIKQELDDFKNTTALEDQRNKINLLYNLIKELDSIADNNKNNYLNEQKINRILSLSSTLKTYRIWNMEFKEYQELSSEKALLLLALVRTNLDTTVFKKIKENISFSGADLRNADLHGLDLSGIDLKQANLEYANMEGVNLSYSNLQGANLKGANLNNSNLVEANFISSKMNWSKINESNLTKTKLDSADLSNSSIQNSNLFKGSMINSNLFNSTLQGSNLNLCLLMNANIRNADLSNTILNKADFNLLNLENVDFTNAVINKFWVEQLINYKNIGINSMLQNFEITIDTKSIKDSTLYRLNVIKK